MATSNDYNLVEESQERLFDCPVCLQVICDPCTSKCCKNDFCRVCIINTVRKSGNQCPLCRKSNFRTQRNNDLSLKVYRLQVYCPNKPKGCEWIGNLGEAEVHLNLSPVMRYQSNGCQFVDIQCMYCSEIFPRCEVSDHHSQCPRRPFSCEFCQNYDSHYSDVSINHWPVCGFYPLICPNNCNEYISRQSLKDHIANDCRMTVIVCDFKPFGCKEKLPRKEMQTHMKNSVAAHESLKMMTRLVSQLKKQDKHLRELETKLHEKHKKLVNEQKDSFERSISSATSELHETLRTVQQQNEHFKELELQLNSRINSKADNIEKVVRHRVDNLLTSRNNEFETQIRELKGEVYHQGVDLYILHHRLRAAQLNHRCACCVHHNPRLNPVAKFVFELLNSDYCNFVCVFICFSSALVGLATTFVLLYF